MPNPEAEAPMTESLKGHYQNALSDLPVLPNARIPLPKPTLTIHYPDGTETTVTPCPMWQP